MKTHIIAASLLGLGLLAGCGDPNEPEDIDVTVEQPDTVEEDLDEAGEAMEESASEAGEHIEDAAEDTEAAINDAGESMTETTDMPE